MIPSDKRLGLWCYETRISKRQRDFLTAFDEDQKQYPYTPLYSGGVELGYKLLLFVVADYH
jgi:hypothetical protein